VAQSFTRCILNLPPRLRFQCVERGDREGAYQADGSCHPARLSRLHGGSWIKRRKDARSHISRTHGASRSRPAVVEASSGEVL
jgi:hypothetical protein